jgi:hypothetical protein
MSINILKKLTVIATAGTFLSPLPVQAAASLIDAFTYGSVSGQFRYRYENVNQDGFDDEANASTLRTQLGFMTDGYRGFVGFVQFENVSVIGDEDYNNTNNLNTQFPVVADPDGTELNQAWISYDAPYNTTLKYGRQGIDFDNQRFIGTVNFRQNQQTFDAFSVANSLISNTTLTYAHVTNVNRIFGEDHPTPANRNFAMSSDLINIAYKGFSAGTLIGYGYFLDFDADDTEGQSHKDIGLRFDGARLVGGRKVTYTAEYATQNDYEDGLDTNDADYGFLSLGTAVAGVQIKLNYEVLEGDGVYAFQTPLATLHAFNGWADRFLITPKDGLEDIFISAGKTIYGINLLAVYHDYSSDNLDYDIGSEWNFSAAKQINKLLTLRAEYATYDADRNSQNVSRNTGPRAIQTTDADILWLTADVQF